MVFNGPGPGDVTGLCSKSIVGQNFQKVNESTAELKPSRTTRSRQEASRDRVAFGSPVFPKFGFLFSKLGFLELTCLFSPLSYLSAYEFSRQEHWDALPFSTPP